MGGGCGGGREFYVLLAEPDVLWCTVHYQSHDRVFKTYIYIVKDNPPLFHNNTKITVLSKYFDRFKNCLNRKSTVCVLQSIYQIKRRGLWELSPPPKSPPKSHPKSHPQNPPKTPKTPQRVPQTLFLFHIQLHPLEEKSRILLYC